MKAKLLTSLAFAALVSSAPGVTIDLFDAQANVDGTFPAVDTSGIADGIGSLSLTVSGAGSHYLGLFLDYEIDETLNTYFNEFGSVMGAPSAGQSWEIDEPGFVFGDIYTNFGLSLLDNTNGVPSGMEDDVSMALGWNFDLLAGETGTATFSLSLTAPSSGFYLVHTDPDSSASIYFSSSLDIRPSGVPEGGFTFGMLVMGITGLWMARFRLSPR